MQVYDLIREMTKINEDLDEAVNNPDMNFEESHKKIKNWIEFMKQEVEIIKEK